MSKLRIGFVLTGSFCTFSKVMPVIQALIERGDTGHADSVRQRRYTRHPLWHSRALARGTDRTHRHLPYRQHCFRRADWTEGAV